MIMDEDTRAEYETQSQQLRIDLKTWETNWAKAHEGKKPGRGDIKANEDIGKFPDRIKDLFLIIGSCEIQAIQQSSRYSLRQNTTPFEGSIQAHKAKIRWFASTNTHQTKQAYRNSSKEPHPKPR
jgi:hypothetical protein